jgi:uncharacterized protein (DUF1778 family)
MSKSALIGPAVEIKVLSRDVISIPAKDWEHFTAWLYKPAESIPALAQLARIAPTWER